MSSEASPPLVEPGVRRALDPRHVEVQRIAGWITAAVLAGPSAVFVLIMLLQRVPIWVKGLTGIGWLALAGLLAWFAQYWPPIAYRHASYLVDEHGIEIRRGVVWRTVTNVPRSRVQHTDVSQGPVERRFGLGTLVMHTAGTEHAMVHLNGLDHRTALALRDHLLPREGGDAV
jgi:membrane protein YdbS with pleckstrin-like domain